MSEEAPILRRNSKYKKLIKLFIFICFIIFVLAFIEQSNQYDEKIQISQMKPIKSSAGAIKHIKSGIGDFEIYIQNLDNDIVKLAQIDENPKYKSIDEIKISRDMDLTKNLEISRSDFCELLSNLKFDYEGFYERNAGIIWDYAQYYQVNEIFMCGLYGLESAHGSNQKHKEAHNYSSIMTRSGVLASYDTDEEGIEASFKLLANEYLNPEGKYYKGKTLDSIGDTYCPPTSECQNWSDRVYECMQMFLLE